MGMYAGHFDWSKPLLWTVPALLTPEECRAIIAGAEGGEWLPATVNSFGGRVVDRRVRDNDTAILTAHDELAALIYQRLSPHLPSTMSREEAGAQSEQSVCGLYLPMRVYRYGEGQRFGLHQDQSYTRAEDGARSFLSLIIYLNDDYAGGETDFPEHQCVVPKQGTALLFQHMMLHAGLPILSGVKYLLRTDVMYRASS